MSNPRHEGRAGLHDFIKAKRTPKPEIARPAPKPEQREQRTLDDIAASVRELGTEHNRAFETLEALAGKKGGESIGNLLRVRSARAEIRDLEERKKQGQLSGPEKIHLQELQKRMKGFSDKEADRMFDAARGALASMVPNNQLRNPSDAFPWLKVPAGQKQSPYQTHLKRVTGEFNIPTAGLSGDEREEIQSMAAQMETAHRNDVFLRKLFGPEKNNPIMTIYGERTRAEQAARPPSEEEVSDKAAE